MPTQLFGLTLVVLVSFGVKLLIFLKLSTVGISLDWRLALCLREFLKVKSFGVFLGEFLRFRCSFIDATLGEKAISSLSFKQFRSIVCEILVFKTRLFGSASMFSFSSKACAWEFSDDV